MIGKLGGAPWTNAEEPLMNPRTVRILGWCYLTAFERPSGGERMARETIEEQNTDSNGGIAATFPVGPDGLPGAPRPPRTAPMGRFRTSSWGRCFGSRRAISAPGCRPTFSESKARLPTSSTTSWPSARAGRPRPRACAAWSARRASSSSACAFPVRSAAGPTRVTALNTLIDDLVWPTTEVTRAIGAVAKGDLSQTMALDVDGRPLEGEFLRSAQLVNKMIDQLSVFTSRGDARRPRGRHRRQARRPGAGARACPGVWKDLTESVNQMAGNLTAQVRNIADVTIAVANGDLSKKITVDVRGEILQLKEAINTMVDQLRSFASEVTRVAREVGTEGKLGGQAVVPGVAGTWKDLTDNVNAMASNLTGQVRNIAEVTTAVARGDLSRKITVDVKGEILELKNTINTMVDQLNGFAVGGDARRARGRHRRQAGRPGAGARRRRHLEGPHRQRQLDGVEPDRPGPQHRRGDHRGRPRRPVAEDHRRRQAARSWS